MRAPTSWRTTSSSPGGSRPIEARRPRVVAVAGITSYRTAFGERKARAGRQERRIAGAEVWVVPNPSGLNAHATLESLAADYREVAAAASVVATR